MKRKNAEITSNLPEKFKDASVPVLQKKKKMKPTVYLIQKQSSMLGKNTTRSL